MEPCLERKNILLAVFSVLQDPTVDNDGNAVNEEAEEAYKDNRQQYYSMAEYQTKIFASPEAQMVNGLVEIWPLLYWKVVNGMSMPQRWSCWQ
mmetsp:Transcript_16488/g.21855  ORF Transcript_16488/g.21855 Transcript_16488/m.21855 type:complete len:93 (-) Transcript_16488:1747-2025(-)